MSDSQIFSCIAIRSPISIDLFVRVANRIAFVGYAYAEKMENHWDITYFQESFEAPISNFSSALEKLNCGDRYKCKLPSATPDVKIIENMIEWLGGNLESLKVLKVKCFEDEFTTSIINTLGEKSPIESNFGGEIQWESGL